MNLRLKRVRTTIYLFACHLHRIHQWWYGVCLTVCPSVRQGGIGRPLFRPCPGVVTAVAAHLRHHRRRTALVASRIACCWQREKSSTPSTTETNRRLDEKAAGWRNGEPPARPFLWPCEVSASATDPACLLW